MKLLDRIFPWNLCCIACNSEQVDPESGLCAPCLQALSFPQQFICERCGREIEIKGLCADCMQNLPIFDRAMAPLLYDGVIRHLLHLLKYDNKQYLAIPLARLMAEALPAEISTQCTLITCVPLHKSRRRKRGYNQSALLAKELAKKWNLPLHENVLQRMRKTEFQAHMTRDERLKNMKNVFAASEKLPAGSVILLVDDIFTTGATVNDCARALKKAGAEKVFVLTVATGSKCPKDKSK